MAEKVNWSEKHADTVDQIRLEYAVKIEKNKNAGLAAFTSGEYQPFRGFSIEKFQKICDFTLELDDASQKQIAGRIVDPLRQLAVKHGIPAIFPNRGDQPAHVAFENGLFSNMPEDQIEYVIRYFASNKSHLNWLSKILTGLTFHHDTLVLAAPTSYVCAGEFDAEQGSIYRTRIAIETIIGRAAKALQREFGEQSVGSVVGDIRYRDIFHTSVMRLIEQVPGARILPFAREAYATVGEDLRKSPLPVTVSNVYIGRATDFHKTHAPANLILP